MRAGRRPRASPARRLFLNATTQSSWRNCDSNLPLQPDAGAYACLGAGRRVGGGGLDGRRRARRRRGNVTCKTALNDQIDADGVPVVIAADQGAQAGSVSCNKLLGGGAMLDRFATDPSGDLSGTYHQYFSAGTVTGEFVLVAGENGTPTPETFTSARYAGTVTLTGGTGVFQGLTGTGRMTCVSRDSLHVRCVERLKLG